MKIVRIVPWAFSAATILVAMYALLFYNESTRMRASSDDCKFIISEADGGKYMAKHCIFRDTAYLALYHAHGKEILAERLYYHGNINRLLWQKDRLIYTTNDYSLIHDGAIELPPTRIDKALTYIP